MLTRPMGTSARTVNWRQLRLLLFAVVGGAGYWLSVGMMILRSLEPVSRRYRGKGTGRSHVAVRMVRTK
jgi:hypothetical protein